MEVKIVVRGPKGDDMEASVPALHFSVRSTPDGYGDVGKIRRFITTAPISWTHFLSLPDLFSPFGEIATKIISLEEMGKCLDIEVERRYRTYKNRW